jgi:hypothetical protein
VELRITGVKVSLGLVKISETRTEVVGLAVKNPAVDNKAIRGTRPKAEGLHFRTC